MIALGQLENTLPMSSKHSGVVVEIGGALVGEYTVHDRICTWGGTAYSGSVMVNKDAVQLIPGNVTVETAASIPIVYATVYYWRSKGSLIVEVSMLYRNLSRARLFMGPSSVLQA